MADAFARAEDDFQLKLQAEQFAAAPTLAPADALALLVRTAQPTSVSDTLDVACAGGSVVAAFAAHARRAVGVDDSEPKLQPCRRLARERGLWNVEFRLGDIMDRLPFRSGVFDVVTCCSALQRFDQPSWALAEMARVCRGGGRIVVCQPLVPTDPAKAAAFERMERLRDPLTLKFPTLDDLRSLFEIAELPRPQETFYRAGVEREALIAASVPADDDRADRLRRLIDASVNGDRLGMKARADGDTVKLSYPTVMVSTVKRSFIGRWLRL